MQRYKIFIIIILTLCVARYTLHASADTADDQILALRKKIAELTAQADQYRKSALDKHKQADTLKRQIDILNTQILQLQKQIEATEQSISVTKLEINDRQHRIYTATQKIEQEQGAIKEAVVYLQQRDRANLLAVLIQNDSLSEFMSQSEDVSRVNARLTSLLTDLKIQKAALEEQRSQLESKKSELEILNKNQVIQQTSLGDSKSTKNKLLVDTKGQEAKYQAMLSDVEKQQAKFFAELRNLEQQAVSNGTIITHIIASSVPKKGTKLFQYPYTDFYLTQGYGNTPFARTHYSGLGHSGIDIVSGPGSPIHAIGVGEILASGYNNGFGNWVTIKHENGMVSMYGHMVQPTGLKIGTHVDTSSVVGYEGSTGSSTGSHLHLSIYKNFFTYINPKNGQLYFNYIDGTVNPLDYL